MSRSARRITTFGVWMTGTALAVQLLMLLFAVVVFVAVLVVLS